MLRLLKKSGRPEVEVYTSDNIVDLLDIKVKDNTLYIGFKKDVNVSYKKLEVRVSAETLNGISCCRFRGCLPEKRSPD